MMMKRLLRRDSRGVGAAEFALVAPVLISFIIGVSQLGRMFFANADMKNAVGAGARVASVYPVPSDSAILAAVNARLVRSEAATKATPTVVRGTDANGNAYVEINMTYSVPLDFIFFSAPAVTLKDTRRVFTQVETANSTTYSSTGGTTSATSSTSAGGTTSASSTSATSAGGTTSSTSATSASSTSASSTTSASSSGDNGSSGNASSGNSNGSNGNGHDHGNCNKKC